MPGRTASGGALAPQPAARHRGRTNGPTDFSEPFFPLFSPLFLRLDVSSVWDGTSIEVRNRTSPTSDFEGEMQNESSHAPSAGAIVRLLWRAAALEKKLLRLPYGQLQVILLETATNCIISGCFAKNQQCGCIGSPLFQSSLLLWSNPVGAPTGATAR